MQSIANDNRSAARQQPDHTYIYQVRPGIYRMYVNGHLRMACWPDRWSALAALRIELRLIEKLGSRSGRWQGDALVLANHPRKSRIKV